MGLREGGEDNATDNNQHINMSDKLSSALDFLRDELRQLRAQDVALLRQMLKIQSTIKAMSRPDERRSHSVADDLEDGKATTDMRPRMNSLDRRPASRGHHLHLDGRPFHPSLSRQRSEPGRMLTQDMEEEMEEEMGDTEDAIEGSGCDIFTFPVVNSSMRETSDNSAGEKPSSTSILLKMRQQFATIEEESPGSLNSSSLSLATSSPIPHSAEGSPTNCHTSPTDVGLRSRVNGAHDTDSGDLSPEAREEQPAFELGYYTMPQAGRLQNDREWHSLDLGQNGAGQGDQTPLWDSLDAIERLSLGTTKRKSSRLEKYEPEYENILKRSSQLWREIQKEQSEKGSVDERKLTTFKLFI